MGHSPELVGVKVRTVGNAEFVEKTKIKLLFENHSKPGVCQYYDFAGQPDIYFEIVERVVGNNIHLLFDTANALVYKQDPVEMMNKLYLLRKHLFLVLKE